MPISENILNELLRISKSKPNVARLWDFYLGGSYNFDVDREFAKKVLARYPQASAIAKANRRFLHRVVRWSIDRGIYQFIDIGAGLPVDDATHFTAERYMPNVCRVLFVDNDPIAHAHSHLMLEEGGDGFGSGRWGAACENFYDPDAILTAAEQQCGIDLDKPVCLMLLSMLHFLETPGPALAKYQRRMASGSALALSHGYDGASGELSDIVADYDQQTNASPNLRNRDDIEAFFGGWSLVEPGLVRLPEWRPDADETGEDGSRAGGPSVLIGGVAVKPD